MSTGKRQAAKSGPGRWLLGLLCVAAIVFPNGCGGGAHGLTARVGAPTGLPPAAELARVTSGTQQVSGADYYRQFGGTVEGSDLVLTYTPPAEATEGSKYMSYAIYAVSTLDEQPLTVEISIPSENEAEYWVGVMDWPELRWDFSLGTQHNKLEMALEDLPGGREHALSPDQTLAVAVVLVDDSAPLTVNFVEVTTISEVSGLEATTDDPFGIALGWDTDEDAKGYHVYRRPAGSGEDDWSQLTEDPLNVYESEYFDDSVEQSVEYEYRVTKGTLEFVSGAPLWFWSAGAVALGKRQATVVDYPMDNFTEYRPANLWNYMSVFYSPFGADHLLEGLRNTSFPPDGDWVHYGGETLDYAHFSMPVLTGFRLPFDVFQEDTLNNPTLTMVASTDDGVWSQVATITPEGLINWEEPVQVRQGEQYLLGLLKMPRRIGAVTWNTALNRIELVDSIDNRGRDWFEFDPEATRQMVGNRMPEGPVECRYFGSGERITFRERDTGLVACYIRDVGWSDISPDLEVAQGPVMRFVLLGPAPGYGLVYLTPDHKRIRMMRQTAAGEWLTNEIEELEIAKGDSSFSEFQLLMSEEISYQSYLIYVRDGNLYFSYTEYATLAGLDHEYPIDESGDVRDVSTISVGSGDEWENRHYVLYVSDNDLGEPQLHFRDLDEARLPH